MAIEVYANGREISCRSGDGKVVAAFPDVCLSPPSPPAGPVPIPYPLNSFSTDTTQGSKTVSICGKEAMLRDKSYFKKCTGDEPATRSLGMGVVTHTITGKVYFVSWSMDVEIEGENVVRHLDVTTSNHASPMANQSVPWTELAAAAFKPGGPCEGMDHLRLLPYRKNKSCKPKTGHHLIPGRCMDGVAKYSHNKAPVICVDGANQHTGSHKLCHDLFDRVEYHYSKNNRQIPYNKARDAAAASAGLALEPPRKLSKAERNCVAFQLDAYYQKLPNGPGCENSQLLNTQGKEGKVASVSTPYRPPWKQT